MTSDAFWGSPLPPEEPQAPNPPRGAYLDYYLPEGAAGEVVLEIVDERSQRVRRFSSREKPEESAQNLPVAPRWLEKPERLSEEAGLHRFVWDLRYGPSGLNSAEDYDEEGSEHWEGPLVLPGQYSVTLRTAGHEWEQPLQVVMDPRSRATQAELREQFDWAQRAFKDLVMARTTAARIEALQAELTKNGEARSPAVADAIKAVAKKAGDILTAGGNKPEQGLQAATRGLTAAFNALESADRMPPSQVVALYTQSAKILRDRLTDWNAVKERALPNLNQQLRTAGLPPVSQPKE